MKLLIAVRQRIPASATALLFVFAAVAPALINTQTASAAQFSERFIRMTSSARAASDVTYNVGFKPTQTGTVLGFVIEFCADSPLVGSTCEAPNTGNSLEAFDVNETTLDVSEDAGQTAWTVNAASTTNRVVLTRAAGGSSETLTSGVAYNIGLGTAAAGDGITNPNPSTNDYTFYARILSYSTAAGATGYTPTAPGAHIDEGGIALSTANQLTTTARVQEQLEFCVAAILGSVDTDAEAPANCQAAPFDGSIGTVVNLGTVDSTLSSITPVDPANGGNSYNGAVMIRTNAAYGVTISYFAEQDTSSGKLKVPGATCSGTSQTDQCFNSADGDTGAAGSQPEDFSGAGEKFGMTAGYKLKQTTDTTDNLTRDGDYDQEGSAGNNTDQFAWVDTGANDPAETLASSTTVVNYEMLVLRFAARAFATTPTGAYQVTSTYIATAKF